MNHSHGVSSPARKSAPGTARETLDVPKMNRPLPPQIRADECKGAHRARVSWLLSSRNWLDSPEFSYLPHESRAKMPAPPIIRKCPMQPAKSTGSQTDSAGAQPAIWQPLLEELRRERETITQGGGAKAVERQHEKRRLTARERVAALIDPGTQFLELGRFAAWKVYEEWGGDAAATVLCGIGTVAGRSFMVIGNDATVKAGAFFPMTVKKVLRAQRIALGNRLPLI